VPLPILRRHGRAARPIGHAVADTETKVHVLERNIVGQDKQFSKKGRAVKQVG